MATLLGLGIATPDKLLLMMKNTICKMQMKSRKHKIKQAKYFSDEYIKAFLTNHTDLKNYCVLQESPNDIGLIYSLSSDGKLYVDIIEEEELTIACIEFLKKSEVPIFSDNNSLDEYEKSCRVRSTEK